MGRKRWFVVKVTAGEADDVQAEVVVISTYATKARADRGPRTSGDRNPRRPQQGRRDRGAGEDEVHRYRAWDAELGQGVPNWDRHRGETRIWGCLAINSDYGSIKTPQSRCCQEQEFAQFVQGQ